MKESLLLRSALEYANRLGWPVFPLKAGTKDGHLTEHGSHSGTLDLDKIRGWWTRHPDANIALTTGVRFFVLDVDPRHGGQESLEKLERTHGRLPDTIQQITGRRDGGRHYLFALPDFEVRNSEGEHGIAPGIDIRGEGFADEAGHEAAGL